MLFKIDFNITEWFDALLTLPNEGVRYFSARNIDLAFHLSVKKDSSCDIVVVKFAKIATWR